MRGSLRSRAGYSHGKRRCSPFVWSSVQHLGCWAPPSCWPWQRQPMQLLRPSSAASHFHECLHGCFVNKRCSTSSVLLHNMGRVTLTVIGCKNLPKVRFHFCRIHSFTPSRSIRLGRATLTSSSSAQTRRPTPPKATSRLQALRIR